MIPRNEGAAIKLEGNAFTGPETPHYEAHKSMENFWGKYRKHGPLHGESTSNIKYTQASKHSLENAGLAFILIE